MDGNEPDHNEVRIGDVSGQVVVGSRNTVIRSDAGSAVPTSAAEKDIARLRAEFARVRALVPMGSPDADRAQELLDELEECVTGDIDLNILEYVRGWFTRRLPALAPDVGDLMVHPVTVGLVTAAGGDRATEFRRRFGTS